ncbi:MAG: SorC family transcriptional regulator [Streptococcaceae bacterium]|jgi:central glycolytic genes regulator|nr:SorC family transcriptional regulator [Streptococcaceae bacterium]
MKNEELFETLVPDMMDTLERRFRILRQIYWMQPVGRRSLIESMGLTERLLRSETEILRELELINISRSGMTLTEQAVEFFPAMERTMNQLYSTREIEKELRKLFGNRRVIVLAGNSDSQPKIITELGRTVTKSLNECLPKGENIIAGMGGSTMSGVAENMQSLETNTRHNIFVPARGGIGETISLQANSVAAVMAKNAGGTHRVLYVPEQVSKATYDLLIEEPAILDTLRLIEKSNCVLHGIGRAIYMAKRRNMTEEEILKLRNLGAVAESFGYFFNEAGEIVYKVPRIGIQLNQLEKIPTIMAIASGKRKGKAVKAYMQNAPKQTWLITDEACAKEILSNTQI